MNGRKVFKFATTAIVESINEIYEKNLIKKGDKFILVAFGGGLTYAATLVEW